jgi:menaquinol-cytochrome c reductase iron-sulfur subunit
MADSVTGRTEPEVSRRGFIGWAIGIGAAFSAAVVGIPMVGSLFGTTPASAKPGDLVKVADMDTLVVGQVTGLTFLQETVDGYVHEELPHSVWVIKQPAGTAIVYSPVCTHLGCQVLWNKDAQKFDCPCHGSIFARDGKVLAGPAPRGLDTLPNKVDKGALYVRWVNYKLDVPVKIPV